MEYTMAGVAYQGQKVTSDAFDLEVKRELTVKEYNRLVRLVEMSRPDMPPPIAEIGQISDPQ